MESEKNIYKEEIDFAQLASQDPDFAQVWVITFLIEV